MKQQQFRGLGFILVIMMMLLMITTFSGQIFTNDDISYQEYLTALADGSVEQVIINQNQQTPTGEVNLFLKDGSAKQYYTSDVIEEQHRLQELGIDYTTTDVPRENMVLTILLPIVISTIAVVILISVMNARSSGGGANARMMNFGRSRARLSRERKNLKRLWIFCVTRRNIPVSVPGFPRGFCWSALREQEKPFWPRR